MDARQSLRLSPSSSDLAELPTAYLEMLASQEFNRARLRAILRLLFKRRRNRAHGQEGGGIPSGQCVRVPIGEVLGLSESGKLGALRPLPRMLKRDWLFSFFLLDEDSDYEAFEALRAGSSWYLEAGQRGLLALEILRSKGAASIRLRQSPTTADPEKSPAKGKRRIFRFYPFPPSRPLSRAC